MAGNISIPPKYPNNGIMCIRGPLLVKLLSPHAEPLKKFKDTDVSWEISVIERDDARTEDTFGDVGTFKTGITVEPPRGYHYEIFEHSQLYKAGYTLQGGPKIYDPDFDSEIILPLYKFKEVEDLSLPFVVGSLVLRESQYTIASSPVAKKEKEEIKSSIRRPAAKTKKSPFS